MLPKIRRLKPVVAGLSRRGLDVKVVDAPTGQRLRLGAVTVQIFGAAPGCRDLWNFRNPANPRHAHGYPNGAREIFIAQFAEVFRVRSVACCDQPREDDDA